MLVSTKREAEAWAAGDPEIISHGDPYEAMEEYLDGLVFERGEPATAEQLRQEFRDLGDVKVTGYARANIPNASLAGRGLSAMTEWLEEEFGDPDGSYGDTKLSDATKTAARMLAKSVLADFSVWMMDPITTVEVNALEWVEKFAPEWLKATAGKS